MIWGVLFCEVFVTIERRARKINAFFSVGTL